MASVVKFEAKPDENVVGTWYRRAVIETGCGTIKLSAVIFPNDLNDCFPARLKLEGSYRGRRYRREGLILGAQRAQLRAQGNRKPARQDSAPARADRRHRQGRAQMAGDAPGRDRSDLSRG
jgi:hypothetical protein